MTWDSRVLHVVNSQPDPLIFATISGAHLYGFPSPDSDYDLRAMHIVDLKDVLGLQARHETREQTSVIEGLEIDFVSHDVRKFLGMLLKKNGYVLEQLFSPLVVHTSAEHTELKGLARHCITRYHAYHYLGFAEGQWKRFEGESQRRVKPLLYVYRVLLTGIHLMRSGHIEANLETLNSEFKLPYLNDLIAQKRGDCEQSLLSESDVEFYKTEFFRLRELLERAMLESALPESPTAEKALDDFLVRVRMRQFEDFFTKAVQTN